MVNCAPAGKRNGRDIHSECASDGSACSTRTPFPPRRTHSSSFARMVAHILDQFARWFCQGALGMHRQHARRRSRSCRCSTKLSMVNGTADPETRAMVNIEFTPAPMVYPFGAAVATAPSFRRAARARPVDEHQGVAEHPRRDPARSCASPVSTGTAGRAGTITWMERAGIPFCRVRHRARPAPGRRHRRSPWQNFASLSHHCGACAYVFSASFLTSGRFARP